MSICYTLHAVRRLVSSTGLPDEICELIFSAVADAYKPRLCITEEPSWLDRFTHWNSFTNGSLFGYQCADPYSANFEERRYVFIRRRGLMGRDFPEIPLHLHKWGYLQ